MVVDEERHMLEDALTDACCACKGDGSSSLAVYYKARINMELHRYRDAEKDMKKAKRMGHEQATDAVLKEITDGFPVEDEECKLPDDVKVHHIEWPKVQPLSEPVC